MKEIQEMKGIKRRKPQEQVVDRKEGALVMDFHWHIARRGAPAEHVWLSELVGRRHVKNACNYGRTSDETSNSLAHLDSYSIRV